MMANFELQVATDLGLLFGIHPSRVSVSVAEEVQGSNRRSLQSDNDTAIITVDEDPKTIVTFTILK